MIRVSLYSVIIFFTFLNHESYAQNAKVTGSVKGMDALLYSIPIEVGNKIFFTDSLGFFSMVLAPGTYKLQITHQGYKKIVQDIQAKPGDSLFLNFIMEIESKEEDMIIIVSRFRNHRNNLRTPVPVDVFFAKELSQTFQPTITQMLQYVVPSFNASRQLVNEPVTLRGLDPDQILVLVNGKPFHNTAFVNFGGVRGILGKGSVSNDLNAIPFSAIKKVEILRDGASAQYGSDAIGGVINIQLKESTDQSSMHIQTGQFYKNDGETISFGLNHGVPVLNKKDLSGKPGFLNLSASFRFQNPTLRGGRFNGTIYENYNPNSSSADSIRTRIIDDSIITARNFNRNNISNAGTSKHIGAGFVANGGFSIKSRTQFFYAALANYRHTVFTSGFILPRMKNSINPAIYPDGIKPRPGNYTKDIWLMTGVKGEAWNNWHWEYSFSYGNNTGRYDNKETNNASQYSILGEDAPTVFYTGSLIYGRLVNNFQLIKKFTGDTKEINLGMGAEYRYERFRIKEGEEGSWKNYEPAGNKTGGSGGLVFSPIDAVIAGRHIAAAYLEIESEFAKRLLLGWATRFEYYSDFGHNLAGKLTARYRLNKQVSIRSSINNGFRAPGLQQRYYGFTRQSVVNVGGINMPVSSGIFRNNSHVAQALGIPSLQAERSLNKWVGIAAQIKPDFNITLDAYHIRIKNRIVLSGAFNKNNRDVESLLAGLTDVFQVQFFTNSINTITKGLDVVMTKNCSFNKHLLETSLAANFTQTRLFGEIKKAGYLKNDSLNSNTLFNIDDRTRLEKGQPSDKVILSLTYIHGRMKFNVRNTRFGKTAIAPPYVDPVSRLTSFLYEHFSPKIITDINITYSTKNQMNFSLGVNNLLNKYPDRLKDYRNTGEGIYIYGQEASPFGFNGGFYFIAMEIKW